MLTTTHTKLVNFPTQAYTQDLTNIDKSMWLKPLSTADFDASRDLLPPANYFVENAEIFGMSNIISSSKNIACLNNIVFNPVNIDKIIDASETCISYEEDKFIFKTKVVHNLVKAIFIGGHWNFGHWLFNHLARVSFVPEPINDKIFILPASLKKNYRGMLYEIGLKDENLFFVEPGMLVKVEELLIPQMPWLSPIEGVVLWSPGAIQKLRKLLKVPQTLYSEADCKVFLTRKNTRWRKLLNEDEIFEKFEKLGFIRIDAADLNAAEQIELGKKTQFLFSPAGANSNFFISMPSNSLMLESAPPMPNMNVSGAFARACGIQYSQLIGKPLVDLNKAELNYDYIIADEDISSAIENFLRLS